ncbi:sialomucin core protein 24-like isoform X2 [Pomacea canaliculata]|uniref:sialomucin core protein 24-like isoform X2 n=1 Tax=Pomacea canaliculata TaxID=400727 RepID=UPI000D73BFEB|nr:sialomucin core protein 24-like isoform X2 [Pomacea canaliculata]
MVNRTAKMLWIILVLGGVALMKVEGASVEANMALLADSYGAKAENTTHHSNVTGETTTHSNVTGETTTHSNVTGETTTLHSNVTGETTTHSNVTGETTTHSNVTGETTTHSNVTQHGNITTVTSPTTSHLSTGTTASTTAQPQKGNSFSVASFFGGMAVAAGVAIIIFVAVRCYNMKKKSNYHAM